MNADQMRLKNIASRVGLDAHIVNVFLYRFWSIFAGGLTVMTVPMFLSPVQQGYFYSFNSLIALQVFFELGMGQVIIQLVAHEASSLTRTPLGSYVGDAEALARLKQIRLLLGRWYQGAAMLFIIVVLTAGVVFFNDGGLAWQYWGGAWTLLVLASAANILMSWKLAVVEGFALVGEIARLRLRQSVIGYGLMWLCLVLGAGLLSATAVPLVAAIMTLTWVNRLPQSQLYHLHSDQQPHLPISWKREILPFQWRIGVSWMSGYLSFNALTLIAFQQIGPVEAGQVGLAINVFNAVASIGISWMVARAPNMTMLIAKGQRDDLMTLFKGSILRSFLSTLLVVGIIIAIWGGVHARDVALADRLPDAAVMLSIAWGTLVNSIIFCVAIYMRAHRQEPLLLMSVFTGILVFLVTWVGSYYSASHMMLGWAGVTTFFALPYAIMVLRRFNAKQAAKSVLDVPANQEP